MAVSHIKTSALPDDPDTSLIRPSDWNSGHHQVATLDGNTAGVSTVSGTNIVFSGGPNLTLSGVQGANVATIGFSGGAGGAGNTGFISAGGATASLGTVVFSDANNVSFGVDGQTVTATATHPAQTNQTLGIYHVGNTAGESSSSTHDARTLSFRGDGFISVGWSNGSVRISGTQTNPVVSNAIQAVGSATGSGTNTSRFAADDHVHEGVFSVGVTNAGNTAGDTRVGPGRYVFAGGANITLSQATAANALNTVSIVGPTVPAQFTGGFSTNGNTAGDTGLVTGRLCLAGGNNITLSGSTNAGSITVTVSAANAPAQTNQTLGLYAVGNTTGESSSSTFDARTVSFRGDGFISLGYSNGSIRISGTQTNPVVSNAIQAVGSATGSGTNTSRFAADDHVHEGVFSVGVSTGGNTAGDTRVGPGRYVFAGGANITLSQATAANALNTVSIVGPTVPAQFSGGMSTAGNTAGDTGFVTGRLAIAGGPNITVSGSTNGGSMTISVSGNAPGAAAENNWHHLLGANTSGNTTASGSTIGLSGINLTLSGTNDSRIVLSAPATSSLSATGIVSISVNGSTVSIGAAQTTLSGANPYIDAVQVVAAQSQHTLLLAPWIVDQDFQFDRFVVPIHFSQATNSTLTVSNSMWWGLFTKNVSTLSLAHSGSGSFSINGSGTASSANNSGIRVATMGNTTTIGPGNYVLGFVWRSTTAGANASLSNIVVSRMNSSFSGLIGVASNASAQFTQGLGIWTSTTSGMPATVAYTDIRGNSSAFQRSPMIYFTSGMV